uniref:Uncharacterized protein n=1 Tax=Alexandrium monilatum TaxID=311494 RepID=A0A7S4VWX2_9DINO
MARRSSTLAVAALVLGALCLARLASDAFLSGAASRREVLGAAVAGAAALGGLAPARADWQGEPIQALQVLGPEIVGLKDAVNSGDLADVSAKLVKSSPSSHRAAADGLTSTPRVCSRTRPPSRRRPPRLSTSFQTLSRTRTSRGSRRHMRSS